MASLTNDDKHKKATRLKSNQNVPLPSGWEAAQDAETGKWFFVDHSTRRTQWFDPRDRLTKPLTIADCDSDELPYGWELANDPKYGIYYIDHVRKKNQREDPRVEWRSLQINMLNSYLQQAEGSEAMTRGSSNGIAGSMNSLAVGSQKDIARLNGNLTNSRPSLAPLSSTPKTNPLLYNRAMLEQSLADAKFRVAQLKRELDANYNLLTMIDKYYKKRDHDAVAVEV